jgi:hypothetical protein
VLALSFISLSSIFLSFQPTGSGSFTKASGLRGSEFSGGRDIARLVELRISFATVVCGFSNMMRGEE